MYLNILKITMCMPLLTNYSDEFMYALTDDFIYALTYKGYYILKLSIYIIPMHTYIHTYKHK